MKVIHIILFVNNTPINELNDNGPLRRPFFFTVIVSISHSKMIMICNGIQPSQINKTWNFMIVK